MSWIKKRILFVCNTILGLFIVGTTAAQEPFWEITNGPGNITVYSLGINHNGDIYAGVSPLGLYRSTDNGDNWSLLDMGFSSPIPNSITFNSKGDIFSGAFNLLTGTSSVYRSSNNGETWSQTGLVLAGVLRIAALAINSTGHLFAGADNGVYRSQNNGDTWIVLNNGLPNTVIRAVSVNKNNDIFVGTEKNGLFHSKDNGDAWAKSNNGLDAPTITAFAFTNNGDIFVGAGDSSSTVATGVFRSTDRGETWRKTGFPDLAVSSLVINQETGDVYAGVAASGAAAGVYRSTDNGETWQQINSGLTNPIVNVLAINSSGFIFVGTIGTASGLYRSTITTTAVEAIATEAPESFTLQQNYPNPFNPCTTIRYALPQAGHVRLAIFDNLGREVKAVVDELKPAGRYQVTVDMSGLSSGMYSYRLQTSEGFSEMRKMIYLR